MNNLENFKYELGRLLDKYKISIVTESHNNPDDLSVDIGFQVGLDNYWTGRHHLTQYDLSKNNLVRSQHTYTKMLKTFKTEDYDYD